MRVALGRTELGLGCIMEYDNGTQWVSELAVRSRAFLKAGNVMMNCLLLTTLRSC